jgi:hypothetical protein
MNCSETRLLLPLALYGDVSAEELREVEVHLAACVACRGERHALVVTRQVLDLVPAASDIAVHLPRIYVASQRQIERRLQRWRWAALVAFATAAGLAILALATRFEFRLEGQQVVLRWGDVPTAPAGVEPVEPTRDLFPTVDRRSQQPAPDVAEQVAVLNQIVRTLLRESLREDDQQSKQELARLEARLAELQRRTQEAERDLRTLYKAQFVLRKEGEGL